MAGEGDAPDYSVFFAREFPRVKRTVYLIIQDHGRAEEISQEAFIQLLRHWGKVSSYDKPEAWIRRVAIRLAVHTTTRERARAFLERKATPTPVSHHDEPVLADALRSLPRDSGRLSSCTITRTTRSTRSPASSSARRTP